MIDLRSDTVTRPSKEMKAKMFDAKLGDDVFVGAHTLITKSINKPGQYIGIMPAQSHSDWAKSSVFIRKRNKD